MQVTEVKFLDRGELGARWKMSPRTLEAWGRENPPRGPVGQRFGKKVLYRLSEVERYESEVFAKPDIRKRGRPSLRTAAVAGRSGGRGPFGSVESA